MKRSYFLVLAICFAIDITGGVYVSNEEAENMAVQYYKKISASSSQEYFQGKAKPVSLNGLAEMWLVQIEDTWILVSSDKRTEAILARFTSSEEPNLKTYPPAAQYLISCYEYDIAYVRDSCKDCPIRSSWNNYEKNAVSTERLDGRVASVAPLLGDIAWRQSRNQSSNPSCSKVYNKFCPQINSGNYSLCGHAVAGCVAVAVGQIMRYWQWPYGAFVPTSIGGNEKEYHFYDWDLMPSILSNSRSLDEANMVASFLRDCGYDLDMDYGESSGATDEAAKETLKNFFYDNSTISLRYKWTTPGWTNFIHEEITSGRPVYYSGCTSFLCTSGHAFILDGFDAGNLYHVNLGWGPYWNDYYYIDTITAGSSSYSHWQKAIWGIQPDRIYCIQNPTLPSINTPKECYAYEGTITMNDIHINNAEDIRIYSETEIIISSGTIIANGSNVQLAIKEVPCDPPITPRIMHNTSNFAAHTSTEYSNNQCVTETEYSYGMEDDNILCRSVYSVDGKLISKKGNVEMLTADLPNGVYILKIETKNGGVFQSKLLINK